MVEARAIMQPPFIYSLKSISSPPPGVLGSVWQTMPVLMCQKSDSGLGDGATKTGRSLVCSRRDIIAQRRARVLVSHLIGEKYQYNINIIMSLDKNVS